MYPAVKQYEAFVASHTFTAMQMMGFNSRVHLNKNIFHHKK
jgi:hypothetical protein